ncbi:MAG: rhodanese-like domain-containing protein [Sphaerochaetaceae bacterium]
MSKIIVIVLISIVLVIGVIWKIRQSGNASYKSISAKEAFSMMQERNDVHIVDVRTPGEFTNEHIQGAVNVPLQTLEAGDFSSLPDKEATLLVYCRSGSRSARASKLLQKQGYSAVYDFGGINNWPYGTVR